MFQVIEGRRVYVIEIPEGVNPFPFTTENEDPELIPYIKAINTAYAIGIPISPGRYAIEVEEVTYSWYISKVVWHWEPSTSKILEGHG